MFKETDCYDLYEIGAAVIKGVLSIIILFWQVFHTIAQPIFILLPDACQVVIGNDFK